MDIRTAKWLGLSTKGQARVGALTGRIKSVAEFFKDAVDAVKDGDLPSRIAQASPWWVGATGEALAKSAPPVKFVAEFIRSATQIRDPDKLAWLACTAAFQRAAELAFAAVGPPHGPRFEAWQPPDSVQPPENFSFKDLSLRNLTAHPFVQEAEEFLRLAATSAGYADSECRLLQREVRMRFPGELKRILSHPDTRERFVAVADWLRFDDQEARVFEAWRTHGDYQRWLFEEAPVFGDESFALANVYVDTECGRLTWGEISAQDSNRPEPSPQGRGPVNPFDELHGGRHGLLDTVMALIGDPSFRDAIVVQGPAGSGKSAFTLRLAVELLRNGLSPIRVRLRDLGQSIRNIDEAIPEAVRFCDEADVQEQPFSVRPSELFMEARLFDQSVAFGKARICPYVLIFDGWDEVSVSAARGFFQQVDYILTQIRDRYLNRPGRPPVRVILTGRPSDAVARSAFLKRSTTVLTIRSLNPDALAKQVQRLVHSRSKTLDIAPALSRCKPFVDRYREDFDAKSTEAKSTERSPAERRPAVEILGLPLLAHLAVRLLMDWSGHGVPDVVENHTTLYRLLTDHTCGSGAFGKDVAERRLQPLRLRTLLQQTAAAMTVYGKDSIPYGELEQRLSELVERSLLDEVRDLDRENPISGLLINFFFKGGHRELGAEFTHKSFREYLTAEAVIEELKDYGHRCSSELPERPVRAYWKDFDPGDERYRFARRLGRILAAQWVTREVAGHLQDLIDWELQRARTPEPAAASGTYRTRPLDLAGWQWVRDGLADLWDWWGEGVHLRPQPIMRGRRFDRLDQSYVYELIDWHIQQDRSDRDYEPSPPRTTTIDAVFGDALCRLTALVHRYVAGDRESAVIDGDADQQNRTRPHAVRRYQSWFKVDGSWQIRFRPSGTDDKYFRFYCARINAAGSRPEGPFPSGIHFAQSDFRDCALDGLIMADCDFSDADLRQANLNQAWTVDSKFVRANLMQAMLGQATFLGVILAAANLAKVRAERTYFADCDLTGADFREAHLDSAELNQCRIAEADFSDCSDLDTLRLIESVGLAEARGLGDKSS